MKIIIVSTIVPFIDGGGSLITDWLELKLKEYGHQTTLYKIPFYPYYPKMVEQMVALRLMNLSNCGDRMIAIRTPSYIMKHHKKIIWFIHHHRGAYDLWGTKYGDIPDNQEGKIIRNSIIKADNLAFKDAYKIFTNSKIISKRLKAFNKVDSEVLYPPLFDSKKFYSGEFGDYIFFPSRITLHKRQTLIAEAMKFVKSKVKLIIAGYPETKEYLKQINEIIKKNHLDNKVKIMNSWISQEDKIKLMADCLGVAYIPFEEDSYGYVSLEAYSSKKPIITCSDSGGTLELVKNNFNGFITEPDPKEMAEAIDKLYYDKKLARKMGENGFETIKNKKINWDNVINKLTL